MPLRSLLTSSPSPQDKVSIHKGKYWDCLPGKGSSSEEQTSCLLTYAGILSLHREFIQVAVGMAFLNGALDPRLASIRLRNGKGYVYMQHLTVHPCFAALALNLCKEKHECSTKEENTFLTYTLYSTYPEGCKNTTKGHSSSLATLPHPDPSPFSPRSRTQRQSPPHCPHPWHPSRGSNAYC